MVKTIKIGDKSFDLKSSAFTPFAYKNECGRDLLDDINSINDIYKNIEKMPIDEQEGEWLKNLTPIVEKTLRLAYIMICEQNKDFKSYNDWLKELDYLFENTSWIMDVMQMAMTPFSGRVQNSANE